MIEIYTDGACSGNPGKGGWGALLRHDGTEKELMGFESMTTNNRMEMMGAIKALEALKKPSIVTLYSDSQYVIKGMKEWLKGWKAKGWKTADKQPVKNVDLWQQLDALNGMHTIQWEWVRGHNNHPDNERADALARKAVLMGEKA